MAFWTLSGTGFACSCISLSPPRPEFARVDAVFSGYVTEIDRTDEAYDVVRVTVEVLTAWKGITGRRVMVHTGWSGAQCGYSFRVGESYLIYAYRSSDGTLRTNMCMRTRPLAGAEEDFRALDLGPFPPAAPIPCTFDARPFQTASDADFDGSGTVDFPDFLAFSQAYGSDLAHCDLDGSGVVGFSDFLRFAGLFGQKLCSRETAVLGLPGNARMEMVWIEAGTFLMGTTEAHETFWTNMGAWQTYNNNEQPAHLVTISKGFYLGKYEVTQGQWVAVMGTRPWLGKDYVWEHPNHPAVWVSWEDVQVFIQKLNDAAGGPLYRLPTEAEWEYACRAKVASPWWFGSDSERLDEYAWYSANARDREEEYGHKVGTRKPNPWGVHDMLGNVWEWVRDGYSGGIYNTSLNRVDPQGDARSLMRIARGGSFLENAGQMRSNTRIYNGPPSTRTHDLGFRLLRVAEPYHKVAQWSRAVVEATVVKDGIPAAGLEVAVSRSIAGRAPDYRWTGQSMDENFVWQAVTDAGGWVEVGVEDDGNQFRKIGVSGYYIVRVSDPESGKVLGQWGSIPLSDGERRSLTLLVDGIPETVVAFADSDLEAAVRKAISKPKWKGRLYPADVSGVTALNVSSSTVESLDGISHLTSLERLEAGANQIRDVSPLSGLTSLRELSLENNRITDILPLAGLASLETVRLSGNQITDVSGLGMLSSLVSLDLSDNQIHDISRLAGVTSLRSLHLAHNMVRDLSPVSSLALMDYLDLGGNLISDISPLEGLASLEELDLSHNQISAISPLSHLILLRKLTLSYNQIEDMSSLPVSSVSHLYMSHNLIRDAAPVSKLLRLNELDLSHNQITAFSLSGVNVQELFLSHNQIVDISLSDLPRLSRLDLSGNRIQDLPGVSISSRLIELSLAGNQIQDISFLPALDLKYRVKFLYLEDNQISDVSPVVDVLHGSMKTLDLSNNQILDLSPLVSDDEDLPGARLILTGNPLSPKAVADQIPALREKWWGVYYETSE